MKKTLTTLSLISLLTPGATFAGSISTEFGSKAVRSSGTSVGVTKANVNNQVMRTSNFNFENNNWSVNGSINAENFKYGTRVGSGSYEDTTTATSGGVGISGEISGGTTFDTPENGQSVEGNLQGAGDVVGEMTSVNDEMSFTQVIPNAEPYVDGSVSYSVGAQNNIAGGNVIEMVDGQTIVDSETLVIDNFYGYESETYTTFSY